MAIWNHLQKKRWRKNLDFMKVEWEEIEEEEVVVLEDHVAEINVEEEEGWDLHIDLTMKGTLIGLEIEEENLEQILEEVEAEADIIVLMKMTNSRSIDLILPEAGLIILNKSILVFIIGLLEINQWEDIALDLMKADQYSMTI